MSDRLESTLIELPRELPRIAAGMRGALRAGYGAVDLKSDLLAGAVVGIVALPLSMALAIASGVPPEHGLYTAIVAGFLIGALGGSRVQVSGPTAAFVVILAPISAKYGLAGLAVASVMAGGLLFAMGVARMGKLLQFIPYPVTAGFTAGIGVVIATLQLKDFFGLTVGRMPDHYVDKVRVLLEASPSWSASDLIVGAATLMVLLVFPRVTKRVPAPLVGLLVGTGLSLLLARMISGFDVATIGSRFEGGIPRRPPLPVLPWMQAGPEGGAFVLSFDTVKELVVPAFAIAMLGAIESLLSAVVADGMTGQKHDPDCELMAQGVGNMVGPFFGGFAATGAIARTATAVRSGARSPIAAMFHSVLVLATMLVLSPWLSYLPMASLAALLLVVAWNMSEAKHFVHVMRTAPRSDALVLVSCFALTVLFDMVVAVSVGVVLAALLFMKRMAELTGGELLTEGHPALPEGTPPGVVVYEIAGPLFFGAAQKAMSALEEISGTVKAVVLDLRSVPAVDATGLVNLESTLSKLWEDGVMVVLGGVQPGPFRAMVRAGLRNEKGRLMICREFDAAIAFVRAHGRASGEVELPAAE